MRKAASVLVLETTLDPLEITWSSSSFRGHVLLNHLRNVYMDLQSSEGLFRTSWKKVLVPFLGSVTGSEPTFMADTAGLVLDLSVLGRSPSWHLDTNWIKLEANRWASAELRLDGEVLRRSYPAGRLRPDPGSAGRRVPGRSASSPPPCWGSSPPSAPPPCR